MFRTNMDEMNVETVDLGHELRQGVDPGLDLPPVMLRLPVAYDFLYRRELDALRCIRDGFNFGQARRGQPPTQIDQRLLRNVDPERADRIGIAHGTQRPGNNTRSTCRGRGDKKRAPRGC